jgi:hypothetical protein
MYASGSKKEKLKLKRKRKKGTNSHMGFEPIKKAKTSSTYSTILVAVYVSEL